MMELVGVVEAGNGSQFEVWTDGSGVELHHWERESNETTVFSLTLEQASALGVHLSTL